MKHCSRWNDGVGFMHSVGVRFLSFDLVMSFSRRFVRSFGP